MRSRSQLLVAALALLLPVSACLADDDEPKSPLGKEMVDMSRNFRKLRRQYADPAQKDSSLALVTAMQKNVETSKTLVPSQLEKIPEADKAKFTAAFQQHLDELAREYALLKDEIATGKADEAKAEMAKIGELKDKSHKELGVEDK